jgi:hypothetical protein
MNRQKLILAILLVLLLVAIFWAVLHTPEQQSVARPVGGTVTKLPATQQRTDDSSRVQLDRLDGRSSSSERFRRNLFALSIEAPTRGKIPQATLPPIQVVQPPPPPEPTQLQLDLGRFTFLGFLKKDARKTIFLGRDRQIFLVRAGDRIANRYEATAITDDAITLHLLDEGGEIVIPLVENTPLYPPAR